MNVCKLITHFPRGFDYLDFYLSKEQTHLGISVYVICKQEPDQKMREVIEGITVFRVPSPYNFFALKELKSLNKSTTFKIVHAHATSCVAYPYLRKICDGKKFVVHVHGTARGVLRAYHHFLRHTPPRLLLQTEASLLRQSIMWRKADAIIAVSNSVKEELTKLYKIRPEKVHVAHNGVDPDLFYPRISSLQIKRKLGVDESSAMILYLGGFRPIKGTAYFIKALAEVVKNLPNAKGVFVGNIESPSEKRYAEIVSDLIRKLNLYKNIVFVKRIPYTEMPDYYSASDILVNTSLYESFNRAQIEAMACGKPVVSHRVGGISEVIDDGINGLLVEPGDTQCLSELITELLINKHLAKKMGEKGMEKARLLFTWENAARKTMEIYQQI